MDSIVEGGGAKPPAYAANVATPASLLSFNNTILTRLRSMGACYRCRLLKIVCSLESVCSSCIKAAGSANSSYLMSCMCTRTHYQARSGGAFRDVKVVLGENDCSEIGISSRCRGEQWEVYIDSDLEGMALEIPMRIFYTGTVLQRFILSPSWGRASKNFEPIYLLPKDAVDVINRSLLPWVVGHQTRHASDSFKDSMHLLMLNYAGSGTPYSDPVGKILEFGCLYRVWNSERRFSYISSDGTHSSLPENISRTLRHTFLVRLVKLESEILKTHHDLALGRELRKMKTKAAKFGIWLFFFAHILLQREMIKSSIWQGDGALEAYQSMRMHASEILVQTRVLSGLYKTIRMPHYVHSLPDGLPESLTPIFERVISLIPSLEKELRSNNSATDRLLLSLSYIVPQAKQNDRSSRW
ncbi:hypothetical protein F4678DRAFT_7181 [Xylaria arbuscula]|nr:hypothetical protein F4678DRAFT_7181 [Xylaria arbuscula]